MERKAEIELALEGSRGDQDMAVGMRPSFTALVEALTARVFGKYRRSSSGHTQ